MEVGSGGHDCDGWDALAACVRGYTLYDRRQQTNVFSTSLYTIGHGLDYWYCSMVIPNLSVYAGPESHPIEYSEYTTKYNNGNRVTHSVDVVIVQKPDSNLASMAMKHGLH